MSSKTDAERELRKKRRKKAPTVRICLDACKYDVLRQVARDLQWKVVSEDSQWDVLWSDCSISSERVLRLITGQVRPTLNGHGFGQSFPVIEIMHACRK